MAKQSKRPGREARDIHAAIRTAADALRAASTFAVSDAADFPELAELLDAAGDAVAAGVPRFVYFHGRNYWLRARLAVQLDLYAQPGDTKPLLRGMSFSTDGHGHAPGQH